MEVHSSVSGQNFWRLRRRGGEDGDVGRKWPQNRVGPLKHRMQHPQSTSPHCPYISNKKCRFVNHQPPKITSLAFSHHSDTQEPAPQSLLLAIGRANGDIDIWSPLNDWVHKIVFALCVFILIADIERRERPFNRGISMDTQTCLPKEYSKSFIFSRFIYISDWMGYRDRTAETTSWF